MNYKEKREEKKNRKKGFFITFALHAGVVALLFLPWVVEHKEKKKVDGIVIQFEEKKWGAASERSSKQGKKTEKVTKKRKSTPKKEEVVKKPEVKPVPKPVPVEPKKPKPVITKEQPKPPFKIPPAPPVPDPPEEIEPKVEEIPEKIPEKVEEVPVEETPVEVPTEDPVLENPEYAGPPPHEDALEDGDGAEESGNEGEGKQGSSDTGDSDTDGKADSGDFGDDFAGDGILMRDVVKKANFNSIIKKAGKMVINVCINPNGEVVFAEYNFDESTIIDEELAELAVDIIHKYRFAKDAYAPKRECGTLSYIVDIKE